jgi:hypothetical protein
MHFEGPNSLPLQFGVDSLFAFLSLIIFVNILSLSSTSRFLLLLILSSVKFFWIWFLAVPSYVVFRCQNPESHWTIDAFWILRLAECLVWWFFGLSSLIKFHFNDFFLSVIGVGISGLTAMKTLRYLKRSSENRFLRSEMPL